MNLTHRCSYFQSIFNDLQATNSIIEKRYIISKIPEWLEDDFQAILECLAGKYVFGYTYAVHEPEGDVRNECNTIRGILDFLEEPRIYGDLSIRNIVKYCGATYPWAWFFMPIVNKDLRLGIGKSILPKDGFSPMLAKKYEGKIKYDSSGYILTEKLDGNRCIASFEEDAGWVFRSRNGKIMHVEFNMGDLPREYVYDGEVMSRTQTLSSIKLHDRLLDNTAAALIYSDEFSTTSGMINRHTGNKDLIYNIFDIMLDDYTYGERRTELNKLQEECTFGYDIRILPVITTVGHDQLEEVAAHFLSSITNMGGEGLMINCVSAPYTHKRTDQLLKLKKAQTIDMKVTGIEWGTGKYEYMVGNLNCECETSDGKIIRCSVGSGLTDSQRQNWVFKPSDIIGKIVEIEYFSMSQNSQQKGSDYYSLRFPRLKKVRVDKSEVSEF